MKYLLAILSLYPMFAGYAQIKPKEQAVLNYRIVNFTVPKHNNAVTYMFEVAQDSVANEKKFSGNTIVNRSTSENTITEILPHWNKKYTWRVTLLDENRKELSKTPLYHFSTGYVSFIDTNLFHLRILENKLGNRPLYFFYDYLKVLYDANGSPLWYLPYIKGVNDTTQTVRIRDLKATPQHTITFLTDSAGFEVDYDGNILWQTPKNGIVSKDSTEHYHHEFTRLSSGNYMILGNETIHRKLPPGADTSIYRKEKTISRKNGALINSIPCGTVIEYDAQGKIVWYWKSSDYFDKEGLFSKVNSDGSINFSTHLNAFYFDEIKRFIYLSFRDISRVVKISYSTKKVIGEYGKNKGKPGEDLFQYQHHCRLTSEGYISLFNNNSIMTNKRPTAGEPSTILLIKEPATSADTLSAIWEFSCAIDTMAKKSAMVGGSVYELSDKSLVCGMGSVNRSFIVNRNNILLWNSLSEMKNGNGDWVPIISYRVFPVEQTDLFKIFK